MGTGQINMPHGQTCVSLSQHHRNELRLELAVARLKTFNKLQECCKTNGKLVNLQQAANEWETSESQ